MIKSVVSKEYQELQKEIVTLQEKWKLQLNPDIIKFHLDQAAMEVGVPAAAFTSIDFQISLFLQWIEEVSGLLITHHPELASELAGIATLLNEETLNRWIEEAFVFNQGYFAAFAKEHGLPEWSPQFLAETALRPYLQLTAEKIQDQVNRAVPGAGCPVCGEPVRLATLDQDGKKIIHCPRCLAHWTARRLECSHCGNEDHQTTYFLEIEGDATSKIQVCEQCNGYIKIVDTRQYITKPSIALLDLNSIHLDMVAQENGYFSSGLKKETN
ncbi:formate dehydrogenase accessory protein FdhE [Neobacillus cucumis]|uniref:formate dehydrogenase accessory protein FdhE n=1 Tax=Neobacillus cucumis TaxID=1740721 RepID=UPI0019653BD2|nr:formate dehydrogenase accessory protein FdhE [Neobacillus cucumis]MBM7653937.1 FdhE protein [Neobacillus cucumis]